MFLSVADKLDSLKGVSKALYDQSYFRKANDCGTAYCIGGWAIELEAKRIGKLYDEIRGDNSSWRVAASILGINPELSKDSQLFSPYFMLGASPQQVAKRLREFVKADLIRFRKSDFPMGVNR